MAADNHGRWPCGHCLAAGTDHHQRGRWRSECHTVDHPLASGGTQPMSRATAGFTLVEVLVVLVLLGLLTVTLASALRLGTRSWQRSTLINQNNEDLALTSGWL